MLTAALGAIVGVLLQNSFNVELLGVNIVLWAMAGVVSVGRARRRRARVPEPGAHRASDAVRRETPSPNRRASRGKVARRSGVAVPLAIGAVVVVALSWFSSTWWRADRSFQAAIDGTVAAHVGREALVDRAISHRELDAAPLPRRVDAATRLSRATRVAEANFVLQALAATNSLTADNVSGLAPVKAMLQSAVDRAPRDPVPLSAYGNLLARLRELAPASGDPKLEAELFAPGRPGEPVQPELRRCGGDRAARRTATSPVPAPLWITV